MPSPSASLLHSSSAIVVQRWVNAQAVVKRRRRVKVASRHRPCIPRMSQTHMLLESDNLHPHRSCRHCEMTHPPTRQVPSSMVAPGRNLGWWHPCTPSKKFRLHRKRHTGQAHIAFTITITFWDSFASTHAAIVNHIAFEQSHVTWNAIASADTTFIEVIASSIVNCGIWLKIARVGIRASDAETCRAARTIVHTHRRIVVASQRVRASLTTAIVIDVGVGVESSRTWTCAAQNDTTAIVFTSIGSL